MKKKNGFIFGILPLVITVGLYLVFYSRIECKPGNAGFWLILAMGAAVGVTIAGFAQNKR